MFCFKLKVTFTYSCISTATIKAYTDGGAGQVCSIVGAEKERYNLYTCNKLFASMPLIKAC